MSTQNKIVKLFTDFGIPLSEDLLESLVEALRQGGRMSPQTTKMNFSPRIKTTPDGNVSLEIVAYDKYWRWIESGRKAGARRVPADVLGKKWQNENAIDARKVILSIQAKRKSSIKFKKSTLNYDKAARSLSFIIQRAIFKRGIKPKPFVDRILDDGRFKEFRNALVPLLGEQYKLIIKGLE